MEEKKVVLSKEEYEALKKQIEYWEYSTKVARQELFEERKETAEKFAERFKEKMKSKYQGTGLWWTEIILMALEICKEITERKGNENG